MPVLYIIAGPNGAGKTTAAYTILPEVINVREYVNADEIARGISPFNPEAIAIQAGKIMLHRIDYLLNKQVSFAIETTLTTISYLKTIAKAKSSGYSVVLFYIWLNKPELAFERVKMRVKKGGHNIPEEVIERRYYKGLSNLPKFISAVDDWYLYNNSEGYYTFIAKCVQNNSEISSLDIYNKIVSYGKEK
ncbi:MAG TPA: zeta toxin family protein [Sphingobacteriaceae bacterium]|nr:zeta toxin family protein [Sphingobacteriaceae bacterium]